MRVQQNTIEQLVIFLPALFLFANYVSPRWAGWLGLAVRRSAARYTRAATSPIRHRAARLQSSASAANAILLLLGALLAAMF